MSDDDPVKREVFTLRRWSQRKLAVARGEPLPPDVADAVREPLAPAPASPPSGAKPMDVAPAPGAAAELPSIDSLTIESDFAAFMRPDVDESLKRGALRKLFSDPHFNAMDGLDVYIDDYTKADPIPPEIVRKLVQARYLFDPPKTRVNARGEVEEIPAEEQVADATGAQDAASPDTSPDTSPDMSRDEAPDVPAENARSSQPLARAGDEPSQ